jgi:hypothetical protein
MAKNIKGRKFVATAASAALVASAIVPVASAAAEFADQSKISPWAADAVAHAVEKGYMKGDGANFNPQATITKAEVATVIFNALGLKTATTGTFTDVPADAWFAGAVNALQAEGIVQGNEGKFEPTKPVTLAEAAQMVVKALGIEGKADLSKFADAATVPAWANAAIQALVANGYVEGGTVNGKLTLDPLGNLTRERLATMFVKVAKVELEGGVTPKPTTPDSATITSVTAVKSNQIDVKFGGAVDTENTTLKLTKGTAEVAAKLTWNADKTVATFTTTAKLTKGDYAVTLADKEGKNLSSKSVAVVDQYVAEIKLLNDTALTNSSSDVAYIYYDVLDQYGESLKASTSIQWSLSAVHTDKRAEGKLEVKKSDNRSFTYGEKIYVTGVYAKSGLSVTKTVEVGTKQALNEVAVAGFVKKGTNEILKELPKGFKVSEYYMVYEGKDQNGNAVDSVNFAKPVTNNDITFISDNVLLVKELTGDDTTVTINGKEYYAISVTPGINVSKGGTVNITAIANKTGKKTEFKTSIVEEQILTSFKMSVPSTMIADGESVEIPFEALDQSGKVITDFSTLAKQTTFNKLSFTASGGNLKLEEQNDGSAKLVYYDDTINWSDPQSTDGIDRTISLTSVVVGGDTSSQLIYIQDKARPVAIAAVDMDNVLVEGAQDEITLSSFNFLDQYGRSMTKVPFISGNDGNVNANDGYIFDNGFFANEGGLKGTEFAGYDFFVRATYKGDNGFLTGLTSNLESKVDVGSDLTLDAIPHNSLVTAKTGLAVRYDIVKVKAGDKQAISPVKNEDLTVVDIAAVKNLKVSSLGKQFVQSSYSNALTGEALAMNTTFDTAAVVPTKHAQDVVLEGTYNGETVYVPSSYITPVSNKLGVTSGLLSVNPLDFKWADFYDATTAKQLRKDASAILKVHVTGTIASGDTVVVDAVSTAVVLSDAAPVVSALAKAPAEATVKPTVTSISSIKYGVHATTGFGQVTIGSSTYTFVDQYGVGIAPKYVSLKVSAIEENKAGYTDNNFTVSGNDTQALNISGAERGDKFLLTITADGVVTTITVTVGADTNSNITNSTNNYLDKVVNQLETQRAK